MRPQQAWLEEEGIVYVGFWEPIYFQRQLGRATQNTASLDQFIKSEPYIRHLAEIGVNQLWSNFSKGYGLEFEKEEQLKIRALCKIAHRYRLRVIAYCTGGSLTPETIRYEADDVDDWCAKTEEGRLASYGHTEFQNFRARPCYTSRGYLEFQKRVISRALEYGCDGIHFDNTNVPAEPGCCKCKRCVELFRKFLAKKYDQRTESGRIAALERWGRANLSFAKEPWYDHSNHPVMQREILVANQQDWLLFRQETFQTALIEWAEYIHKLGGAVEYNAGKGFNSNYRMFCAINEEALYPHADMLFNEGALELGYNRVGAPHTRIREHKVVQNFDLPLMTYNQNTHMLAEAFSFNPGMVGLWLIATDPALETEKLRFVQFYHQYKPYQTKQVSLAEVAILLDNESITFSQLDTLLALCSLTQLLQEEAVPFNFIYNKDLDALTQYKLILIPSMHCLKERAAEKLGTWARAGGRLLTTGKTGTRDDYFRLRTKVKTIQILQDMYHARQTENVFTALTGEDYSQDFVKPVGMGLVAHIRELQYSSAPNLDTPDEWRIEAEHINRPVNSVAIMAVIAQLLPSRNLRVTSKQDVLVDLCRRKDTGEGLAHIFNVSFAKNIEAAAAVEIIWSEPVKSLTWIAYNRDEMDVPFEKTANGARFELRAIRESAVIIINKKTY
ncbi:MAG: beta-galactosidase trimerization domain-containing protein [Planctomycetota bacterium]